MRSFSHKQQDDVNSYGMREHKRMNEKHIDKHIIT